MKKSNFDFMKNRLPDLYILAAQAEQLADGNPLLALENLQQIGRMLVRQIVMEEELVADETETMALLETLISNEIMPSSLLSALKQLEYTDVRESELLLEPGEVIKLLRRMYDVTGWYYKTYIDDEYDSEPMILQPQDISLSRIQKEPGWMPADVIIQGREAAADWQERVVENEQSLETEDHETYQGQMWHGMKHGIGTYRWSDGTLYSGQWNRDVEHGKGVKHFANGDNFHGEWRDGLFHGKGTYAWKDGSRYEGGWEHHLAHGYGTLTRSDGSVKRGLWVRGEFAMNQDVLSE